jgi:hypothetical protein
MNLSLFIINFAMILILVIIALYNKEDKFDIIISKIIMFIMLVLFYIASLIFFNEYKGLTSNKQLIPDYKIEYKIIDGVNKIDTTYYYYMKD